MVFLLIACSQDENIGSASLLYPGSFELKYPKNGQACLDGTIVNDLQSRVTLRWSNSNNSSTYSINIKNLEDNSNLVFESSTNSREVF